MPSGLQSITEFTPVTSIATQRLLQLMGDAEAIGNSLTGNSPAELGKDFLNLSHATLLALLKSDQLKARSENSGLMVTDAWVAGPKGSLCTAAQLRQVTESLRLSQLSKTFLFDVLPQLTWSELSAKESAAIAHFAAQSSEWRKLFFALDNRPGSLLWYAARAAVAYDELVVVGEIKRADLEEKLKSAKSGIICSTKLTPSPSFFNGFSIDFYLAVDSDGTRSYSGLYPIIIRLGGSAASLNYLSKYSSGSSKVLNCAPRAGVSFEATWSNSYQPAGTVAGDLRLSLVSQPFDISSWEPYFTDGKLSALGTISMCT